MTQQQNEPAHPMGTIIGVLIEMDRKNVRKAAAYYDERVIIAPLPAAPELPVTVPDGWVLVPKSPTEEMLAACKRLPAHEPLFVAAYRAMVGAAPALQMQEGNAHG